MSRGYCHKNVTAMFAAVAAVFILVAVSACSTTNLAVNMTSSVMKEGIVTFFEETDRDLARRGLESNLKLLEVFQRANPANKNMRVLLAEAYGGYSYIFLDTDLLYEKDSKAAKKISARMSNFYSRGKNYGLSILKEDEGFKKAMDKNDVELLASAATRITAADKDALFWTVFNWALLVNMDRSSTDNISDIPRLRILIDRMVALDGDYFHGAPFALKGVIECSIPKMLGGKPDVGTKNMELALKSAKRF
ncbi:MAG: TRAP transporter TatT component family protein [Pseudomonadota bacterium]